ncbi:hypothetical protein QBC47DRAFT_55893 [Echria macrotheca]|uniref:Uncharacterized protein n=1 Tax=Echria macrotheca TaxID=438768 RepID=A0AAJ0B703_9PEZI|nr:hypothetical protein QBC47DRAFT_55893 [Echria macrotheca]
MHLLPCCSHRNPTETWGDVGPCGWVSETVEIIIGAACSVLTWRFTIQSENSLQAESLNQEQLLEPSPGGLFLRPSPELMLCSCLIFGCCVSSFVHRRQEEDTLQFFVYAVYLAAAITAGYGLGASTNLILLGYVPWAMCFAMASSLSGHALYRWSRLEGGLRLGDEEKARSRW